ncbi:MAG: Rrf2 family transcriptional regulator [Alphaproteobacteria bacterium]
MLHLPRRQLLLLTAMLDIASGDGSPVRASELAARHNHPPRYLEPALQRLVKAGLLVARRGPQGGYLLGKPASGITLADVLKHGADPLEERCCKGDSALTTTVITPVLTGLLGRVEDELGRITLSDLRGAARQALTCSDAPQDYII